MLLILKKKHNFVCALSNQDKGAKVKKKKIPKDLEKRLLETFDVNPVKKYNFNEETSNEELVEIVNRILLYLDNQEKKE